VVVVVGESLIDVVDGSADRRETVGGSALNVATTLAGLDVPTILITEIGPDERGEQITARIVASGVELVAPPSPTGRTATATVALVDGEASYDFDIGWALPHQQLPQCDALHVGSLGTVLEPGRTSVLDLVEQAWERDVFVSYDPNVRAPLVGDPVQAWGDVEALAARADLVKISVEDVGALHPRADPGDIARTLLQGDRTEIVLLTSGRGGATGFTAGGSVHVPAPEVELVDTVGAGDAFMAACLAVLYEDGAFDHYGNGLPTDRTRLERLLRAAVEVAAITCSRPGAAAPMRSELRPDWP
jgi:fructokinase